MLAECLKWGRKLPSMKIPTFNADAVDVLVWEIDLAPAKPFRFLDTTVRSRAALGDFVAATISSREFTVPPADAG